MEHLNPTKKVIIDILASIGAVISWALNFISQKMPTSEFNTEFWENYDVVITPIMKTGSVLVGVITFIWFALRVFEWLENRKDD